MKILIKPIKIKKIEKFLFFRNKEKTKKFKHNIA